MPCTRCKTEPRSPKHHSWCRSCLSDDADRRLFEGRRFKVSFTLPPEAFAKARKHAQEANLSLQAWALRELFERPAPRRRRPYRTPPATKTVRLWLFPEERALIGGKRPGDRIRNRLLERLLP